MHWGWVSGLVISLHESLCSLLFLFLVHERLDSDPLNVFLRELAVHQFVPDVALGLGDVVGLAGGVAAGRGGGGGCFGVSSCVGGRIALQASCLLDEGPEPLQVGDQPPSKVLEHAAADVLLPLGVVDLVGDLQGLGLRGRLAA